MIDHKVMEDIYNLYKNEQLLIFVGAGVSKNSNYPSWDDFTKEIMKNELNISVPQREITFFEHLTYAQYLYNICPKRYTRILENTFNRGGLTSSLVHKKIMDLGVSDIFTTNYDNLLKKVKSYTTSQYDEIESDRCLLKSTSKRKIIKIHGGVKDINSIVLKEADYLNFKINKKAIYNYMMYQFFNKSLLFVGYSLSDYNIREILNEIKNYTSELDHEHTKTSYFLTFKKDIPSNLWKYNVKAMKKMGIKVIDLDKLSLSTADKNRLNIEGLSDDRGQKIYKFLSMLENYNLSSFEVKQRLAIIEERLNKLNCQNIISIQEITNILELKNNCFRYSNFTLSINSVEIFLSLEKLNENNATLLKEVCKKSSIQQINHTNKQTQILLFTDNEFAEIFKNNQKQILHKLLENITTDCSYKLGRETKEDIQSRLHFLKVKDDNSFTSKVNAINSIIINQNILPQNAFKDDSPVNFQDKVDFLYNSWTAEEKIIHKFLSNLSKYQFHFYQKMIQDCKDLIHRKVNPNCIVYDSKNEIDVLKIIVFDIYVYPIKNNIDLYYFKGDFKTIATSMASMLSELISSKFRYTDNYGKANKIDLFILLFISMVLDNNDLIKIFKNNSVTEIQFDFDESILIDFILKYIEKIAKNNYGYQSTNNQFTLNILTFIFLGSDANLKGFLLQNLCSHRFQELGISYVLKSIRIIDSEHITINDEVANQLIAYCLNNKDKDNLSKLTSIFRNKKFNISKENKIAILKKLENEPITSLKEWIFSFDYIEEVKTLLENISLNDHTDPILVSNLFIKKYIPFKNYLIQMKKSKEQLILNDKHGINFNIMTPSKLDTFTLQKIDLDHLSIKEKHLLYEHFKISDNSFYKKRDYTFLEIVINQYTDINLMHNPSFKEADFIQELINIGIPINKKWIFDQLLELEKKGLINNRGYYLLGICSGFK